MLRILAIIAPSIAASMSASSNTMNGALPPSSIAGFTMLSAASCSSLRPTSVEPVNETTRTRGSCSIALTTLPDERDGIDVDAARRHAGLFQDRHQRQHGQRRVGRGLEHHRAAGGERRADLAGRHRGREIPRRHQHRDAGRLVLHHDARARGRRIVELPEIAHALFRVPAEELGGIGDLAARIRQRLAVLDGDQLRQPLGVAHDQLERLAQDLAALARLLRGPGRLRGGGGVDRRLGIIDRGARDRGDLVLGRGIDHVEARAVGGFAPLAADPEVGRDVGEEIFVHWPCGFFRLCLRRFRIGCANSAGEAPLVGKAAAIAAVTVSIACSTCPASLLFGGGAVAHLGQIGAVAAR